ncbi:MAG: hypothetical protein WAU86_01450 [Oricola sp.]
MNRNVLYVVIAVLVVAIGVLGYQYYQDTKEPDGIKIEIGKDGLTVKTQ